MSFSYRDETEELNELTRQEASGSFVQLSGGFTHYELSNPEAEETVVLAHGFSVPYFIYDPTFAFLTYAGFRVVRYDLFGRGFSDRPDTPYNIDLFVKQLGDLLDALRFSRAVSLVGLSTGGPITAAYTARCPERVKKLVLIDPVGAKPFALSRVLKVAAMPLLGEAIIGMLGTRGMATVISSDFADRSFAAQVRDKYIVQLKFKGFKRAILSTIRNHMLDSFLDVYERIGKMDKPVLLIWGQHDRTVPFKHSEILRAAMPHAEFHAIENCGHVPHCESPARVNAILQRFLRS
jgi:pimeloyl-ACP methyl ester carboxylesterase